MIDTRDPSLITRMRRPPKWILALSIALSLLAEMIVTPWFDENKQYNPQNEASAPSYSQLVWKGSTKLGIGHAYSGEKLFIVTLYEPSGNVRGQFASNVGCGPNERPWMTKWISLFLSSLNGEKINASDRLIDQNIASASMIDLSFFWKESRAAENCVDEQIPSTDWTVRKNTSFWAVNECMIVINADLAEKGRCDSLFILLWWNETVESSQSNASTNSSTRIR